MYCAGGLWNVKGSVESFFFPETTLTLDSTGNICHFFENEDTYPGVLAF